MQVGKPEIIQGINERKLFNNPLAKILKYYFTNNGITPLSIRVMFLTCFLILNCSQERVEMNKSSFFAKYKFNDSTLERCKISWDELKSIHDDYVSRESELKETAELFVRTIQRCKKVHSVRWRIKDPSHLLEKIIRKKDPESEFHNQKYENISTENYHELITDLIGVRAIHLFKEDFIDIDKFICGYWKKHEKVTVYKRIGDNEDDFKQLNGDFEIKEHSAGYRSIHYIFETRPMSKLIYVEAQVRTIFEEGWSEIDHNIRYPNFSDDELVGYFLKVFNRMAGSADEMGSFVKNLVSEIDSYKNNVNQLIAEKDTHIQQIEELVSKLETLNSKNTEAQSTISSLKKEMSNLKEKSKSTYISAHNKEQMSIFSTLDIERPKGARLVAKNIIKG